MANVRRPLDHHLGHVCRALRNIAVDARKLSIARWMENMERTREKIGRKPEIRTDRGSPAVVP